MIKQSCLVNVSLDVKEHVNDVSRNEQHRGESHKPANALPPAWEHVLAHGQRSHLYCTEGKNPLRTQNFLNCHVFQQSSYRSLVGSN